MNWETLARRYEGRVLLISRSILGDGDLSHDAAQESLVKLRKTNGRIRISTPSQLEALLLQHAEAEMRVVIDGEPILLPRP